MGKIVFLGSHPELFNRIKRFCAARHFPRSTIESLSAGMNHAEIGALIAEKWNFPDSLVAAIRYHHNPQGAPEEFRILAESVYLANMFCEYESGNITFDQFEEVPLARCHISAKAQMDTLLEHFSRGFRKESGE
jgi:HD-like signal output (HDOD) protein